MQTTDDDDTRHHRAFVVEQSSTDVAPAPVLQDPSRSRMAAITQPE